MEDCIDKIANSTIQHGSLSNRIYLMHLDLKDLPIIFNEMNTLCKQKGYTKIFCKVPAGALPDFVSRGYIQEAFIPKFFQGKEDGYFMCRYLAEGRQVEKNNQIISEILNPREGVQFVEPQLFDQTRFDIIPMTIDRANEMAALYSEVFPSYPFPIKDPNYLKRTMQNHVQYFGVLENNQLKALSAAEMNENEKNVEMTDFATLPSHRKLGLATCLLSTMEEFVCHKGYLTAYTIARAMTVGINLIFKNRGFMYSGTLTNNTCIGGQIESMNVWYKNLQKI